MLLSLDLKQKIYYNLFYEYELKKKNKKSID